MAAILIQVGIGLLKAIYLICLAVPACYVVGHAYILYGYLKHFNKPIPEPPSQLDEEDWPHVTVQLPFYNERYVAQRVINAVCALEYPGDKLHIQVLDDSTDDTTEFVQDQITHLQAQGIRIDLIRRGARTGYKAGALANALPLTDGEFIAIFDADFVPERDFLRRTIPYFTLGENIGVVQARWGYLNAEDNVLTHSQELALDAHFGVNMFVHQHANLLGSFNGTCGIWRRKCIEDAGGWQADTLTEDFDLSYRAHIRGWRFFYVQDVMCAGELPAQMVAFKQQQSRWSKGATQVMLKLTWTLLSCNLSVRERLMGLLQLFQYTVQIFILLLLIMTPFLLITHSLDVHMETPLRVVIVLAPLLYLFGQQSIHNNWGRRVRYVPMAMLLSCGMIVNNSRAVIEALCGKQSEFKRTPKFQAAPGSSKAEWKHSQYMIKAGKDVFWELGLGLYCLFSLVTALHYEPAFVPYFLFYMLSLFTVVGWSLAESWSAIP